VFKRIKEWVFKIEQNRLLLQERARLTERIEKLTLRLEDFSDQSNWQEEYPFDEPMFIKWIGKTKPWLRAEEALLRDRIDTDDEGLNDEIRLPNVVQEICMYEELSHEEGRQSDGGELEGEIYPRYLELD